MQGDDIEFARLAQVHLRPSGTVDHYYIVSVAGNPADDFKRILGGDDLREGIPLAADQSVAMPVAGG